MSNHNDGGPAFPSENKQGQIDGMTLRDYFAAMASKEDIERVYFYNRPDLTRQQARYIHADAMLAAREAGQ